MLPYINILNSKISTYGILIASGIIIANISVFHMAKKNKDSIDDIIILEGYGLIGGFIGAKLMYIAVLLNQIGWDTLFQPKNIPLIINGGFVFYGGLILGVFTSLSCGKIHKIQTIDFLKKYIFAIPLAHAFGRLGCFFVGCCYGIPYSKIGAVRFPSNSFAPHNIPLFPVQLLESILLFLLSVILYTLSKKSKSSYNIEIYLFLYGLIRVLIEFLRFDSVRGVYWGVSTSQYISFVLILISTFCFLLRKRKKGTLS
ncbi:MAG: prolipoprotein diacylglyceryl transferase [Hornefia sp.]|nr:prolipoprotein diacylglyceryl transferase [Hornefia sp.]